jgi:hypothetical protein
MLGLLNFKRNKLIYREISNYFYILKIISKQRKSEEWKNFKLRSDLIGRIYTVISLREEDMGDIEDIKRIRVLERLHPINVYLTSLDLQEIVLPQIEQIKDSRSYLITYVPLFSQFSWKWIIFNVIFPIGAILLLTV